MPGEFLAGVHLDATGFARLRDAAHARGFAILVDSGKCVLAAEPETEIAQLDEETVILGTLFPHDPSSPASLAKWQSNSPSDPGTGHCLIEKFWGSFLAFLFDGGRVHILRSPFGTLPCLYTWCGAGIVLASQPGLLRTFDGSGLSIDYAAVVRHLIERDMRHHSTCLAEIEELQGGEQLSVTPHHVSQRSLWTPRHYATHPTQIPDIEDEAAHLRDCVMQCVAQRTAGMHRPLLMLSGGLDSSIVAACLAQLGRDFLCFNAVTRDRAGNELDQAASVARHFGAGLVTEPFSADGMSFEKLAGLPLARPVARTLEQHAYRLACATASRLGCDAILDGGGGDNVFCSLRSPAFAADCLLEEGAWKDFWPVCKTIAALARVPVWTVAWRAWLRAYGRGRSYDWPCERHLLSRHAASVADGSPDHPWLREAHRLLPGRSAHVALLVAVQGYAEDGPHGFRRDAQSPLVSQPLIENCLKISSRYWFARQNNRAMARRAFARVLPSHIAWRRGKGAPDSFVVQLVQDNAVAILAFLRSGLLAQANVLDVPAISAILSAPWTATGADCSRIMRFVDTESWARAITAQ